MAIGDNIQEKGGRNVQEKVQMEQARDKLRHYEGVIGPVLS